MRGLDFERSGTRPKPRRHAHRNSSHRRGNGTLPLGDGIALPARLRVCRRLDLPAGRREMKHARLRAGVGFDLERAVVLPADPQAPRQAHHARRRVGPALQSRRFILGGIPRVDDFARLRFIRNAGGVALERRHHAPAIILGDHGNPIAREVDGRGLLGGTRRGRGTAASELRVAQNREGRGRQENKDGSFHILILPRSYLAVRLL